MIKPNSDDKVEHLLLIAVRNNKFLYAILRADMILMLFYTFLLEFVFENFHSAFLFFLLDLIICAFLLSVALYDVTYLLKKELEKDIVMGYKIGTWKRNVRDVKILTICIYFLCFMMYILILNGLENRLEEDHGGLQSLLSIISNNLTSFSWCFIFSDLALVLLAGISFIYWNCIIYIIIGRL